jgi:hypothetical protein
MEVVTKKAPKEPGDTASINVGGLTDWLEDHKEKRKITVKSPKYAIRTLDLKSKTPAGPSPPSMNLGFKTQQSSSLSGTRPLGTESTRYAALKLQEGLLLGTPARRLKKRWRCFGVAAFRLSESAE